MAVQPSNGEKQEHMQSGSMWDQCSARTNNLLLDIILPDSVLDCSAVPTLQPCHDLKMAPIYFVCKYLLIFKGQALIPLREPPWV